MKQILFHDEARKKLLKGFDIAADAVGGTLGPKGRNAFIEKPYQDLITNDGASIAASIELEDKFEDMGARIIRNAAAKTDDDCGDGTTTTAVLLQAIVHECLKRPENPMEIRDSLIEAGKEAVSLLKAKSVEAKPEDLKSVAIISSENEEIANLITQITDKLGDNAVINVDDSKTFESSAEVIAGYDAPVGFLSPYFITDKNTGKAILEDVHVLVSEKKISNLTDIRKIAKEFEDNNIAQAVIVCDDIDDSMVGVFVGNKLKGAFQSIIIKAHGEILEDIEGAVGATAVADRNGLNFQNIELSHLGHCQKVVCDANKVVFLGTTATASVRAGQLDGMAESEQNQYRKRKLKDRAAKLRGGVGILHIGANSDYERDYLKLKAEDAIKAVQAAKEEGIIMGGGTALWMASRYFLSDENKTIGKEVLTKALAVPLMKMLENAGLDVVSISGKIWMAKGYDIKTRDFVDVYEKGIIDPTKVERCSVENAISAAATFITSFVAITDEPTKK